jgi:superfamily II DNA or RNA helicase
MNLWQHQIDGLANLAEAIESGENRICVTAPTGSGKTRLMFEHIKRTPGDIVVHTDRKLLRDQLSQNMTEAGMEHGIIASGIEPSAGRVQIAMMQTLVSRSVKGNRMLHPAKTICFDECHKSCGDGGMSLRERYGSNVVDIGFTATPLNVGHVYDHLIVAGTNSELRRAKCIVPAYHYGPDEPDQKWVGKIKVDEGECGIVYSKRMEYAQRVFGSVMKHYELLNVDRSPTILFAPGVKESIWFAAEFNKHGYRAAHIDGNDVWIDGELHQKTPELVEQVRLELESGTVNVVTNRFCLDDQTEILTDTGWVKMEEMTKEHRVANWDNGRIDFSPPRELIRRKRLPGERMVVLETSRRSIRVTEKHQMLYRTGRNGVFTKATAGSLVGKRLSVPVSGMSEPLTRKLEQPQLLPMTNRRINATAYLLRNRGMEHGEARKESIRRLKDRDESMKYKQPHELTEDECEFIGFWMGDGNLNKLSSGGVEYRMYENTGHKQIVARVEQLIESVGTDCVRRRRDTETQEPMLQWSFPRGTGYGPQRRNGLFPIEPYLKKSGTELLWALNNVQFTAVLRGLWMANGFPHGDSVELPPAKLIICSARKPLFDLLQSICVCRGYRASVRSHKQSRSDHVMHLLSLTKRDSHEMTKYALQFEDGWKDEEVWCVESESGNIITRRNGSATVMGNCLREGIDWPFVTHCIFATVFGSLTSYVQAGGRVLRVAPGKDRAVIIDHGGAWWRHGSLNADRNWKLIHTDRIAQGLRAQAIREKKDPEPIVCPKCNMCRLSGAQCPSCGFRYNKKVRQVLQKDGSLREMRGDIYKKRRLIMHEENYEREWASRVRNVRLSNSPRVQSMTFAQLEAKFAMDHDWQWPLRFWKSMPKNDMDWFLPVSEVHDLTD